MSHLNKSLLNNLFVYSILLFLFNIPNVFGQSANTLKKSEIKRAVEAYSLLLGQDYSLNLLRKELPKFDSEVLRAQYRFDSMFGKSREKINQFLKNYFGEDKFQKLDIDNKIEIIKMYENISFSDEDAKNVILEINKRADGNIPLGILETLLSFQFLDKPYEEFSNGFTYTFTTKGHLKSKNTDWQIKIPKSWRASEGNRPNIIQTFQSDFRSGNPTFIIMNIDYPNAKNNASSKGVLNNFLTETEIRAFIPKEAKFISFTKMTFDGIIGGMTVYEQLGESLEYKFKMRMAQFVFLKDGKLYLVAGGVSSQNINLDLSEEMDKYLLLYKAIANSIVVNSQYK